jgi:hypothetical protein
VQNAGKAQLTTNSSPNVTKAAPKIKVESKRKEVQDKKGRQQTVERKRPAWHGSHAPYDRKVLRSLLIRIMQVLPDSWGKQR